MASSSSPIALLLVVLMFSVVSHIPSSTAINILDRFMMFDEGIMKSVGTKGGVGCPDEDCCDRCVCTLSIPPQCLCLDVKTYCPSTWKDCWCTESIPPQCTNHETKYHCDPSCDDDSATATVRAAGDR